MQLFVRGLKCIETLEVSQDASIAAVKARIAQLHGYNTEDITLNCEGDALANETPVSALSCFELDVTIPMLGGKVHGSLARAGKVRSQTPKVEKQEKKKEKTGRAKKRMQYNRRFANVTIDKFGRPRGPNSNS